MKKKLFTITHTRYIWTIAHYILGEAGSLDDAPTQQISDLAFSHGARDAETYRISRRHHNAGQLEEKNSFQSIEQISRLTDEKNGVRLSDEIMDFLTNERQFFQFGEQGIEVLNPFVPGHYNNSNLELLKIYITDSIFLPHLTGGDERADENRNIHQIGYLYTLNYLKGFFFGIFIYLRRDQITGAYYFGRGFNCCYQGYQHNSFVFTICTEQADGNLRLEQQNEAFNNEILIGNYHRRNFNIHNTRFIWTIRRLTNFLGNSERITPGFRALLERLAFSHGARDFETYRDELATALPAQPPSLPAITSFLINKDIFDCTVTRTGPEELRIEIRDGTSDGRPDPQSLNIFLPHMPNGNEAMYNAFRQYTELTRDEFLAAKNLENKQIHQVGFVYTRNYLLGFFTSYIHAVTRHNVSGFYTNDGSHAISYAGYIKGAFTFLFSPSALRQNDAAFDNAPLLVD